MQRWRSGDEVLVRDGDAFLLFSEDGVVQRRQSPRSDSLEDSLYDTGWAVEGVQLVERTVVRTRGEPDRLLVERVVRDGLCALDAGAFPTEVEVRAWMAADQQGLRAAADERARRVDALLHGPAGRSSSLAAASRLLAHRIVHYGDALATQLLAGMDAAAGHDAAAPHLARAARFVAFQPMVGDADEAAAHPLAPPPQLGVPWLEELASALLSAADSQERVDALRTAVAYRRAVTCLVRAAESLGDGVRAELDEQTARRDTPV